MTSSEAYAAVLQRLALLALQRHDDALRLPTTAAPHKLRQGIDSLPIVLPTTGWGFDKTSHFLVDEIVEVLAPGHNATRYFGFVTGGVTPIATIADFLTTLYDQNVQVHLPKETLSTLIEIHTIDLLCQLLSLPTDQFTGTITTGATASNLLGLACAREEVLKRAMRRRGYHDWSLAEDGYHAADSEEDSSAEVSPPPASLHVYVALPHASIRKSAGILGIGRKRVVDLGERPTFPTPNLSIDAQVKDSACVLNFDLPRLEEALKRSYAKKQGAIVVVGLGEVNTGALTLQIPQLRNLCDRYDAWLHVDAAFSAFIGLLDGFEWVGQHLQLADSITSDAHKQLNVPYDAGLFFIRKKEKREDRIDSVLEDVCGLGKGGAPAYLASATDDDDLEEISVESQTRREYAANLPSPLFRNLENSKRFRALPIYATLLSEGREGIRSIVQRNVSFARSIEAWMRSSDGSKYYQVLSPPSDTSPPTCTSDGTPIPWTGAWSTTILLFRPHPTSCPVEEFRDPILGASKCIEAIKATRSLYVSPTTWGGKGAIRLAVSNWRTALENDKGEVVNGVHESYDYQVTIETLQQVMDLTT